MVQSREQVVEEMLTQAHRVAAVQLEDLEQAFRSIVEASEEGTHDDEHDPDGSTIAFERASVAALIESTQRQISALDNAFTRLREGTYGTCEICGTDIPVERLASLPATRRCVNCAR